MSALARFKKAFRASIWRVLRAVSVWGLNATYLAAITAIITTLSIIFAAAFFMRPGLAEVLGGMLANYCLASGQCDLNAFMAGLAVALIALTNMLILFVAFMVWNFQDDTEDLAEDDMVKRLAAIESQLSRQNELLDILMLPTEPEHLEELSAEASRA